MAQYYQEHREEILRKRKERIRQIKEDPEKYAEYLTKAALNNALYTRRHSEAKRAQSKAYREAHRDEINEKKKLYYEENRERIIEKKRQEYRENRESILAYKKRIYAAKKLEEAKK